MESSTSDLSTTLNGFTLVPQGLYPEFFQKRQNELCKDWKVWAYHKPPAPISIANIETAKIPAKSIAKIPNTAEIDGTVTYKGEEFYENGSVRYRGTYNSSGAKHGPGQFFSTCNAGYLPSNQDLSYNPINLSKSTKQIAQTFLREELSIEASYSNGTKHGTWAFHERSENWQTLQYFIIGTNEKSAWNFELKKPQDLWPENNPTKPNTPSSPTPITVQFCHGDMTGT